jgi:hypothetical protein
MMGIVEKKLLVESGWTQKSFQLYKEWGGDILVDEEWITSRRRIVRHYLPTEHLLPFVQSEKARSYFSDLYARRSARTVSNPVVIDVLDATREASRSAHRWRDRASTNWEIGWRGRAGNASSEKRYWYDLKERGIIHLHRSGVLRYVGVSPQGMGVYEYGDGGLQCLHSTLHPVGVDRNVVEGHPEILFVPSKDQKFRLKDVEFTLFGLSRDVEGYERSNSPRMKYTPPVEEEEWHQEWRDSGLLESSTRKTATDEAFQANSPRLSV